MTSEERRTAVNRARTDGFTLKRIAEDIGTTGPNLAGILRRGGKYSPFVSLLEKWLIDQGYIDLIGPIKEESIIEPKDDFDSDAATKELNNEISKAFSRYGRSVRHIPSFTKLDESYSVTDWPGTRITIGDLRQTLKQANSLKAESFSWEFASILEEIQRCHYRLDDLEVQYQKAKDEMKKYILSREDETSPDLR